VPKGLQVQILSWASAILAKSQDRWLL